MSQAGRSLGATAEKAVPSLDADAVRALPPMISRSAPMPVASSSSRRSGIWPTLGYAALAAIVLAIPNKRPGERSQPADRGRPASGAMGTTRSTDEPREVQHQRAHEPGRGRHATAPWQIPWAGWKDILWRTYQQINEDRVLAVAAGVVFYGLLAVFPAITAVVSLYLLADLFEMSQPRLSSEFGRFGETARWPLEGHWDASSRLLTAVVDKDVEASDFLSRMAGEVVPE